MGKRELIATYGLVVFSVKLVHIVGEGVWRGFLKLGFTPCKVEQSLWGMELQEKEPKKD